MSPTEPEKKVIRFEFIGLVLGALGFVLLLIFIWRFPYRNPVRSAPPQAKTEISRPQPRSEFSPPPKTELPPPEPSKDQPGGPVETEPASPAKAESAGPAKEAPPSPAKTGLATPSRTGPAGAATTKPAGPAKTEPQSSPRFYVQVAALSNRKDADEFAAQVSARYHFQVVVAPVEVGGKTLHRVRIPAHTRREAQAVAATLRRDPKLQVWIVDSHELGMD